MLKNLSSEETGSSYEQVFVFSDNPRKIYWIKVKKSRKTGKG